jgi:hypothetical protein
MGRKIVKRKKLKKEERSQIHDQLFFLLDEIDSNFRLTYSNFESNAKN